MKIYIEIRKDSNGEVVKRLDVTGKSEREIDTIERGMNRNLNQMEYSTWVYQSEDKLPII